MANNNFNAPAFPDDKNLGLTKLEYLSGQCMQGVLSAIYNDTERFKNFSKVAKENNITITEFVSGLSVEYAKQLLTELEKSNQ